MPLGRVIKSKTQAYFCLGNLKEYKNRPTCNRILNESILIQDCLFASSTTIEYNTSIVKLTRYNHHNLGLWMSSMHRDRTQQD